MCLIAASPEDAYTHYQDAISLCKTYGDGVWAGGAAEGLAAAVVAHTASKNMCHPRDVHVLAEAVSR